eukprot:gene16987-biopygen3353
MELAVVETVTLARNASWPAPATLTGRSAAVSCPHAVALVIRASLGGREAAEWNARVEQRTHAIIAACVLRVSWAMGLARTCVLGQCLCPEEYNGNSVCGDSCNITGIGCDIYACPAGLYGDNCQKECPDYNKHPITGVVTRPSRASGPTRMSSWEIQGRLKETQEGFERAQEAELGFIPDANPLIRAWFPQATFSGPASGQDLAYAKSFLQPFEHDFCKVAVLPGTAISISRGLPGHEVLICPGRVLWLPFPVVSDQRRAPRGRSHTG